MQSDTIRPVGFEWGSVARGALWRSAFQVAALGALAGGLLSLLDYGRRGLSNLPLHLTWAEHVSNVTLMVLAGYVAGMLGALMLRPLLRLTRLASTRLGVSPELPTCFVLATACLVVIVPVAIALFQGRAIRQTRIAGWGPWAVSVVGWVLCALGVWGIQRLHASLAERRRTLWLSAALLAGAATLLAPLIYGDLYLFQGLYEYLHALLMALCFVVLALALHLILGEWRERAAVLVSALLLPCLPIFAYASTRYDTGIADFATHFAYTSRVITLARTLTDLDGDGYSHILGHKDPAVLDSAIRPLAIDVPDDGVDEDGVFGDLHRAELETARQRYAHGRSAAARVRYRAASGAGGPANLLLITIDTLRADRVLPDSILAKGVFETEAFTDAAAPLDWQAFSDFKHGSVRFERAFASSSYTQASVTKLLTGRHDAENADASLFDVLQAEGCTTLLAFAATPFEILASSQPNVVKSFERREVVADREPGDLAMFHSYAATRPTSKTVVDRALELLAANQTKRTCTWVYLFDVHQWQQLSDPEVVGDASSSGAERYDRAVAYTLKQVSRLLHGVESLGLADHTLVALSGDHGESLGEKGIVGHTRWVHDPLLRVPLLIRAPGLAPHPVEEAEVGLIDVAPTLLDLLDADHGLPDLDGASLLPVMLGDVAPHVVFAHEESYDVVLGNGFKLVVDRPEGRYRLFDLRADREETTSLFGLPSHQSVARELYYAYQAGALGPWNGKRGDKTLAHRSE